MRTLKTGYVTLSGLLYGKKRRRPCEFFITVSMGGAYLESFKHPSKGNGEFEGGFIPINLVLECDRWK